MSDQFATLPNGVRVCYRIDGADDSPPILLVAGLGEDLSTWSQRFVSSLVAVGFRVIRLDNRDCGRSTFVESPAPNTLRQLFARPRRDAYTLADMAADAVGLLDHLDIDAAHLVGRSMGGMIAQTIAARHPDRVMTLTSLYSTTGHKKVGQPATSTMLMLVSPPPKNRVQFVREHLRMTAHLAGVGYPLDEVEEAGHAVETWSRTDGDSAAGVARQIQAIQASGDRTRELETVTAPTLIVNGDRDLIVAPSGGEATAAAIAESRHIVVAGMGHHLPDALALTIADHVIAHIGATTRQEIGK